MNMQKLSEQTNVINWFEIPVSDSARARKFYENILDIKMETRIIEETKEEITFFPSVPGVIAATSGRVSGVLVKNKRSKPSKEGTLVYLNASPSIQTVIDRIENAGGKILVPKTTAMYGCFSVFVDTEGNRVAIHAEA